MAQNYFQQLAAIVPNVSHETFSDLLAYEALLRKWQPHINLVANSTLDNLWQRHILDSAQLFPLGQKGQIWLDFGSGGGFPALVLACFLKQRKRGQPQKAHIFLLESNGKKAAFLRQVIHHLALPATVCHGRIEDKISSLPVPDIITARALAPLERLLPFFAPLFARAEGAQPLALLPKGRGFEEEIAQARKNWQFFCAAEPSKIDSQSVILLIRNLAARKGV